MWLYESKQLLHPEKRIDWIDSQNWSDSEITQRGKFSDPFPRMKYAVIGCGCMGASIAELLVRAGIRRLTVIDNDIATVGNMARHILTLQDIEKSKAVAVKNRLNAINPHARIEAVEKKLELDENDMQSIDLSMYDVVIDCTGEDSVLHTLSRGRYRRKGIFMSVSIGIEAEHVYMNMQELQKLDFTYFPAEIVGYLRDEQEEAESLRLPRDGIGCWHPTFPARSDSVWAAAILTVKALEQYSEKEEKLNSTLVFQKCRDEYASGYQLVERYEHE